VSENESFIDEVKEEVRRDKLYLFLRRYGWVPAVMILSIILGSIFVEVGSNTKRAESEKLGDLLSKSLNGITKDAEYTPSDLSAELDPKSLIALMVKAKILENKSDYKTAITVYEGILNFKGLENSLRDFVKFKLLLFIKDDPIRIESLLADLINPNNPFKLLALEQKAIIEVREKKLGEAVSTLTLLINSSEASKSIISRATQMKNAIKLNSF
jgi:hypothetical protein